MKRLIIIFFLASLPVAWFFIRPDREVQSVDVHGTADALALPDISASPLIVQPDESDTSQLAKTSAFAFVQNTHVTAEASSATTTSTIAATQSGSLSTNTQDGQIAADRKPGNKTSTALLHSVTDILQGVDMTDEGVRARVVAELKAAEGARYDAVIARANQLGVPLTKEFSRGRIGYLFSFREDNSPIYKLRMNANAAISSGANLLYPSPYNLNGGGIRVGVWDEGSVRSTHRELTGRVVNNDSGTAINDHATHVAGTIAATGVTASARGMANGVIIESYDWNSDYAEMSAAGAVSASDTSRIPISNHSYGYGATNVDMGRYDVAASDADSTAAALPFYLPFWAAGNEQTDLGLKGGYQSITFVGLAKNLLTVGAVNDAVSGGTRSVANGTMSSFSSWGPCDDGRIKPDVVANGVSVNSTVETSDSAYATYNGTSMATPSAAGSAALLAQLYAREFSNQRMLASMMKALLIHNADDLGRAGPDYQFGWGLINVKKAADLILAHKSTPSAPRMITNLVSAAAASRTNTFVWDGTSAIRVTLVWTDPAGASQTASDSRTPNLRNNLDLRVFSPNGATNFPYVMPYVGNWTDAFMTNLAIKADNNVDNVEVVDIASPGQAGTYAITVGRDGALFSSTQTYSLVISGSSAVNVPPGITSIGSRNVTVGSNLAFAVTASDVDGDSIVLSASGLPAGASFNSVTNTGGVTNNFVWNNASPTGTYNVTFRAVDKDGTNTEAVVISVENPVVLAVYTNPAAITINDNAAASLYPSTISINGVSGTIKRVAATIRGLTHTYPADVDIVLVGPDGTKAGLLGNSGGGTDVSVITLTFDDTASSGVGAALSGGTWSPSGAVDTDMPSPAPALPYPATLTNFVGKSPNGTWSLYVADRAATDFGSISNGWSLLIELDSPAVQPPATPSYGMRDDAGANLPTITYWHNGLGVDATEQGAAFAKSFGSRTNFFIKGAAIKTWKNGGDVTGTSFKYKIWNATNIEPASYTTRVVGFTSNDGVSNQTWAAFGSEIDVLAGLAAGNYNLKILFDVSGTGTPGILTNGPFTATFSIPESPPAVPAAIRASQTNATSFTASWTAAAGATSYRLDVATHPAFEGRDENLVLIDEDFVDITGWFNEGTFNNNSTFGLASPSRSMRGGTAINSPAVNYPTQLVFFVSADNNDNGKPSTTYYSLNGGATWSNLATFAVNSSGIIITQAVPSLANATNVRFRFVSSFNTWYLDDVRVTGVGEFSSKYVPGYSNLTVNATNQLVTGLTLGATYYMRVRAANSIGISSNSPVASVTTLDQIPDEPPVFALVDPQTAIAGVSTGFVVFATGRPDPVVDLAATDVTGSYVFDPASGALAYTPNFADVGIRSFTFTAINSAGVATQVVQVTVSPAIPAAPASIWASDITSSNMLVEWGAVDGAETYRLDVGTSADFVSGGGASSVIYSNSFTGWSSTWLDGWSHNSGVIYPTNGINGSGSIGMNAAGDWIQAPAVLNPGSMSFQLRTSSDPGSWTVVLQTSSDQTNWTSRATYVENGSGGDIDDNYRLTNITLNLTGTVYIRWSMTARSADSCFIDDVIVRSSEGSGASFLPGYSNRTVSATSQSVTGLVAQTSYYFRVRAVNGQGTSSNSPTGDATTLPGNPVAPVFVAIAPQTAFVGRAFSLFIEASGLPTPEVSLTNTTASSGFSFTPDTGRLSYQPPAGDLGARAFTFIASNIAGVATQIVSVLVTNAPPAAPVIDPIPSQSMLLGSTLNYTVNATDADGSSFRFSVTSTVASSTWTFNTNTGAFAFTPTASQIGTNSFIFRAIDTTSLTSAPVTMIVAVSDQADAVGVSLGATRIVAEEGVASVNIPVKLDYAGTAQVRFRFVGPSVGTAQRGSDFNCQTQLLVSGSSTGNLLVNLTDDDLVEGPESIIVQIIPVAPASAGSVTQAVLHLRDNDSVSIVAANITSGNNQQYEAAGTRILQALAPDIALLQEFETTNGTSASAYRAWVNQTFGTNFNYVVEPGDNIPNGIVSRWPIKDWGEWQDTQVGDRDFVWAIIDVPGTQDLHAVSVHLKASSGFESTRAAQARSLTNNIAADGWPTNGFVVIGGDFNLQVRTEEAMRILTNRVVSDNRPSADQNGNRNTNAGRDKPYDLVLPSRTLDARSKSLSLWGYTFANGVVFDTRVTWANGLPPPALAADSADFNMQHMAAMKVFELEVTTTSFKQDQVITFPSIANQIATGRVVLAASAGSGLPVSYAVSGPASLVLVSNLSFSGTGTVRVVASQAGNETWNPAPSVTNTFTVSKATQIIEFPVIAAQDVTNTVELFAAASSGLTCTFAVTNGSATITAGDELSFQATGTVRVVARQDGNAMWNAAPPVTNSVTVNGLPPVVTNAPVPVPVDWLAQNFPAASSNDYGVLVTNPAANGVMTVWQAYVAGIDPNNPTSVLALTAEDIPPGAPNADDFVLRWSSVSGRIYRIGTKTNLLEPFNWIVVPATPPLNAYTNAPPGGGVYYRIGVQME